MEPRLAERRCEACRGGLPPLTPGRLSELLAQVPSWQLSPEGTRIFRQFSFKNFHHTMAFTNAVAWVAHLEDHHPDLTLRFGSCEVSYYTHATGGLTENDFICAAKVDALYADLGVKGKGAR